MKIVFITNSYYPYFSAIGKCIYNLVTEMKNEHEVIVLSNMNMSGLSEEDIFDGHKVMRVRTKDMKQRDEINKFNHNDKLFINTINSVKMLTLRTLDYLKIISGSTTIQKSLTKEYLRVLSSLKNVDIIIPTCYPFEAIIASQTYKKKYNKNIKVIPLLFDKYSDSPTLHRNNLNKNLKYKKHLALEEEIIKDAEKVFYVDSWIDHMENHFSKFSEKLVHIEHPLIINYAPKLLDKKIESNSNFIDIIYTGVLDKKVRPPFKTLKIISKILEKNKKFRFHFYVLGNCDKELNEYHIKYPQNIFNHGQVQSDIALSKIMESNILLSIGNTDVSLIPSKIFEYMSCGKPIIHFYTSEEDRIISLLKEYNLGYCVKQDEGSNEYKINQIINFFEVNKANNVSFDEVEQIFFKATPKFISEKIIDSIIN
ncbi:hypothetical protein [Carnobacterium inhibens]|uniref:hypothetical protein n=1 Tax=Carnobacterium inhibens TaxID=147709 RepID=UPI0005509295|nr:hypothetical protein [Carnobacterium inhibens]